jgi:hypothetical protein
MVYGPEHDRPSRGMGSYGTEKSVPDMPKCGNCRWLIDYGNDLKGVLGTCRVPLPPFRVSGTEMYQAPVKHHYWCVLWEKNNVCP